MVKSKTQPRMVISTSSGLTPKVTANAFLASAIVILRSPAMAAGCGNGIGLNFSPRNSMPKVFQRVIGDGVAQFLPPDFSTLQLGVF